MDLVLKGSIVFILVSLGFCLFLGRRHPHNPHIRYVTIGLLCMVVVLAAVYFLIPKPEISPDGVLLVSSFDGSAGCMFGRSIAEDFPDGGKVVLVRRITGDRWMNEKWDARIAGLKEGFGGKDLQIVEFQPPESGPELDFDREAQEMIRALIEKHPDAVAAVSFEPFFGGLDTSQLGRDIPALYLTVSARSEQWKDLMRRGVIRAVIRTREFANQGSEPPSGASIEEIFSLRYILIRKNDLEDNGAG